MINLSERSVFFVGMPRDASKDLTDCLTRSVIFSEYFTTPEGCRDALERNPCDLIVIRVEQAASRELELLGDSRPPMGQIPKLALVNHGDIPMAVESIKAGATDCLEKSLDASRLCSEIRTMLDQSDRIPAGSVPKMTRMQKIVLKHILQGRTARETGRILHRSPRTIEVHRAELKRKLGASNLVDLIKKAVSLGLGDESRSSP